jgi:two-component system, OmpR family, response regulator
MMATILIADDTKPVQLLTAAQLRPFYEVVCADDGEAAWDILYKRHIDLLVADIMMPRLDGYGLLKKMRSGKIDIPVLLLTAKQTIEDKREGFNAGTDDYMTKPVDYDELILRINALLRRARIVHERSISIGKCTIDERNLTAVYDGNDLQLSRKEFDLLYKFLSYPGRIFTKKQLLEDVWGSYADCTEDTIKTHINRLRNKLSGCSEFELITIKGFGYKVELKQDAAK